MNNANSRLIEPETFPENMRSPLASLYTGVSESNLAKLRMLGMRKLGPRFSKIAGCVVYRKSDLDAWIEAGMVSSD